MRSSSTFRPARRITAGGTFAVCRGLCLLTLVGMVACNGAGPAEPEQPPGHAQALAAVGMLDQLAATMAEGPADAGPADAGPADATLAVAPPVVGEICPVRAEPPAPDPGFPSIDSAMDSLGIDPRTLVASASEDAKAETKAPVGAQPQPPAAQPVPPKVAATEDCCLCTYQHIVGCGTKRDEPSCTAAKDCQWTARGSCVGRFQEQCKTWLEQQGQRCTRRATVAEPADGTEFQGGVCKSIRAQRYGHSNFPSGCQAIQSTVRVCLGAQPACGNFDLNYDGCWTFSDVPGAYKHMQEIAKTLGGDQCVTVSANQCLASEACQTRYNFSITRNNVCHERPGACQIGGFCHGGLSKKCYPNGDHGKAALCFENNGIKSQVCCCSKVDADGVRSDCSFKEGRTCP